MNRNTLVKAVIFVAGAAIGSAVTWKCVKTKYEQIAKDEIDSVKEEYGRINKLMRKEIDACRKLREAHKDDIEDETEDETDEELVDDDSVDDDDRDFTEHEMEQINYYKLTSKYRSDSNDDENNEEGDGNEDDELQFIDGPYVISPEDFASSPPGYSASPLDYYADGVLADGWGVKLDIEETIGEDALEHFGEYVDDIVYVRNERTEIDYEVTRDPRTYEEAEWAYSDPSSHYAR